MPDMAAHRQPTLPNFLVIGAMKAGTTSLYQYLRAHPDVFMSSPKELHFFSARGGNDLGWYEARFADVGAATAIGEASASYTTHPGCDGVPERIATAIPNARLIYLVRNPIERICSHYLQRLGGGDETVPIDRALLSEPTYVETSRYAKQVERYLEHFARERILIVTSEDLRNHRRPTMEKVFGFLGVDSSHWEPSVMQREFYQTSAKRVPRHIAHLARRLPPARWLAHHVPTSIAGIGRLIATERSREEAGRPSAATIEKIADVLREDVRRLRTYMDPDFDGWGIG